LWYDWKTKHSTKYNLAAAYHDLLSKEVHSCQEDLHNYSLG